MFFTHACVASVARSLARHGVPRLPRRAALHARRGATRPAGRAHSTASGELGPKELARPSARCVGRRYGSGRGRSDAKLTAGRACWVVRAEKALSRRRGRVWARPAGRVAPRRAARLGRRGTPCRARLRATEATHARVKNTPRRARASLNRGTRRPYSLLPRRGKLQQLQ